MSARARRVRGAWAILVAMGVAALAWPGVAVGQVVASPHGTLPAGTDCAACHTAEGWSPLRSPLPFVHDSTDFELTGAHGAVSCIQCHGGLRFDTRKAATSDCAACHVDVHEGRMMQECASCHTTRTFRSVDGPRIHARGAFPLTGAHQQVACESCHADDRSGRFTARPTECVECHRADYAAARTVDHVASGYPTDCVQCHGTVAWQDAPAFDHAAVSRGFALIGAHAPLRCASCHVEPAMTPRFHPASSSDCVACHRADYDREHAGSRFSTDCVSCHTIDTWEDPKLDHSLTGFALVGAHAKAECVGCHTPDHRGLKFAAPKGQTDCVACHQTDYDHEHGSTGFPTTCATCHTVDTWDGAQVDHASLSGGFQLLGAHSASSCTSCHVVPGYALLFPKPGGTQDCVACHKADYDRRHAGTGFPTTCTTCHTVTTWAGAKADHASFSGGFPLLGAHAVTECSSCHAEPGHALLFPKPAGAQDCVACHKTDYDRQHAGTGFSTTCTACHTVDTWAGATVDHATLSGGFQLLGAHASSQCTSCHAVPGYALLFPKPAGTQDCVACHKTDYDQQHAGTGFPTTCTTCHTVSTWAGATVDHATLSGGFQLLGAHASSQCTSCHAVPGYALLFPKPAGTQDCVACHKTDYDQQHAGTGFPTTCTTCHTVSTWASTYDHDRQFFPIYSGAHREKWSSCANCHTAPNDFKVFTCLTCHEHAQPAMDQKHRGRSGYSYSSPSCLSCHPRGRA